MKNINISTVAAYKTSDGSLFECYQKAQDHQENIVGELLDKFLPHDDRGNITASDRFNILTKQLESPTLVKDITALYNALTFNEDEQ